jgi:hypothetical protein
MADILCGYTADRDETLIAYVYGEIEPAQRAAFDAHIGTCDRCRKELADLRGVRGRLQEWTAPAIGSIARDVASVGGMGGVGPGRPPAPSVGRAGIWVTLGQVPAWAQVAAALLVLGVSAGVANLDVRYDRSGLSIHTGWSRTPARVESSGPGGVAGIQTADAKSAATPWRTDLNALERRLRTEFHGSAPSGGAALMVRDAGSAPSIEPQLLRRVRALVDDSERKQQTELALRIAEVVREFDTKRKTDLANIDWNFKAMQSNTSMRVATGQQLMRDYIDGTVVPIISRQK